MRWNRKLAVKIATERNKRDRSIFKRDVISRYTEDKLIFIDESTI